VGKWGDPAVPSGVLSRGRGPLFCGFEPFFAAAVSENGGVGGRFVAICHGAHPICGAKDKKSFAKAKKRLSKLAGMV